METRQTFVITLFCDPHRQVEPGGRLRHIATNREATFKDLAELTRLLRRFATGDEPYSPVEPSRPS